MAPVETALLRAAQKAYERGRARRAAVETLWALPVVALVIAACRDASLGVAAGGVAATAVFALRWWGGPAGRGVWPGLLAGVVPALAALAVTAALRHSCGWRACWQVCVGSCVAAGILAGVLVGRAASRLAAGRGQFVASAAGLALAVGAPACLFAGAVGVAGMLIGFAISAAPLAMRPANAVT